MSDNELTPDGLWPLLSDSVDGHVINDIHSAWEADKDEIVRLKADLKSARSIIEGVRNGC